MRRPDFNLPDFATLTMTRMLEQVGTELAISRRAGDVVGSSLGGTLAILAADRRLAGRDWCCRSGRDVRQARSPLLPPEEIDAWRRRGSLPFFHYADGADRPLNYAFYEDTLRYNPFNADVRQPA